MPKPMSGGCACRAIRYEIAAEPVMAVHCHCLDCQKASGAGHASMVMVPAAAFRLTGQPRFHASTADSGNRVERGFCPDCGSPVMGRNNAMPTMIAVSVGSLDDPSGFRPNVVVYTKRAHAWDRMGPALPAFPAMPPMPAA